MRGGVNPNTRYEGSASFAGETSFRRGGEDLKQVRRFGSCPTKYGFLSVP